MLRCRLLGHRYRFRAEERVMVWVCQRGCGSSGRKAYASAEQAARYARVLDHDDRNEVGRRAPLLGLFPLRIIHALRRRGA